MSGLKKMEDGFLDRLPVRGLDDPFIAACQQRGLLLSQVSLRNAAAGSMRRWLVRPGAR